MHTDYEPLEPTNNNLLLACLAGVFTAASVASIIIAITLKPSAIAIASFALGAAAASVTPIIPIVLGVIFGIGALLAVGYLIYKCALLPIETRNEIFEELPKSYIVMDPLGCKPNSYIDLEYAQNQTHLHYDANRPVYQHPSFFETPRQVHKHPSVISNDSSNVHYHPTQI